MNSPIYWLLISLAVLAVFMSGFHFGRTNLMERMRSIDWAWRLYLAVLMILLLGTAIGYAVGRSV